MKTKVIRTLLTLAFAAFTLPMLSQDYLTLYLKNGQKERHLLSLVKSISTSKYDLEGVLHSDFQVQQIILEDTICSYLIEDIDSVSFRKIDADLVAENVSEVITTINTILENSPSPNFSLIADEIFNMRGVEEVQLEDDVLIVKTKDWRNIVYYNTPDIADYLNNPVMTRNVSPIERVQKSSIVVNNSVNVAITNQFINDEDRTIVDEENKQLKNKFESLGYHVDYITDIDFDFYYSGLFNYDIVMLGTHGSYTLGKHWMLTNYELLESSIPVVGTIIDLLKEGYGKFTGDIDDITYYCIKEKRGGKRKWIYYAAVSEDYILKSSSKFKKDAIIFANVCQSVKKNDNLPHIFTQKGASVYLGYDETAYHGWEAGPKFFTNLLNGKSVIRAYNSIDNGYRTEYDTFEKANLKLYTKKKDKESLFITKTITAPKTEIRDKALDNGSHLVTIVGYTSALENDIKGGFEISENPNMEDSQSDNRSLRETVNANGNYTFEMDITAPSDFTFYYRAYTYDGQHYNFGDICSYTTEKHQVDPNKELMISRQVDGVDYKVYKKIVDKSDYHENPDGWKTYRSQLILEITKGSNTNSIVLDDHIYLDDSKGHHGGQTPCMVLDYNSNRMCVFCNSKDEDYQYSMEGYAYISPINDINFKKETVFTYANMGWYPYFRNLGDGSVTVDFFSYAGYYAIRAIRQSDGSWDLYLGGQIYPEDYAAMQAENPAILVIGK